MPTKRKEAEEVIEQPSQEIDSKYRLIILAAKRSKQLQRGARPRIITDPTKHKFTRIALEEVIQGRVRFYRTIDGERTSESPANFYSSQAPGLVADFGREARIYLSGGLEGDPATDIPREIRDGDPATDIGRLPSLDEE